MLKIFFLINFLVQHYLKTVIIQKQGPDIDFYFFLPEIFSQIHMH